MIKIVRGNKSRIQGVDTLSNNRKKILDLNKDNLRIEIGLFRQIRSTGRNTEANFLNSHIWGKYVGFRPALYNTKW